MAYAEFGDEDHTVALLEVPNAVMIRTLSKAWGLAGLRVGFAVGARERIHVLRGYGGPYALTGPSIAIALDRLKHGVADMRGFVEYVRSRRERLAKVIRGVGGGPQPSQTNFVLARSRTRAGSSGEWPRRGFWCATSRTCRSMCVSRCRGTTGSSAAWSGRWQCLNEPEALLFDMDGVLADVRRSYREAIVQTCAAFGVEAGHDLITAVKAEGRANDDWA